MKLKELETKRKYTSKNQEHVFDEEKEAEIKRYQKEIERVVNKNKALEKIVGQQTRKINENNLKNNNYVLNIKDNEMFTDFVESDVYVMLQDSEVRDAVEYLFTFTPRSKRFLSDYSTARNDVAKSVKKWIDNVYFVSTKGKLTTNYEVEEVSTVGHDPIKQTPTDVIRVVLKHKANIRSSKLPKVKVATDGQIRWRRVFITIKKYMLQ